MAWLTPSGDPPLKSKDITLDLQSGKIPGICNKDSSKWFAVSGTVYYHIQLVIDEAEGIHWEVSG